MAFKDVAEHKENKDNIGVPICGIKKGEYYKGTTNAEWVSCKRCLKIMSDKDSQEEKQYGG